MQITSQVAHKKAHVTQKSVLEATHKLNLWKTTSTLPELVGGKVFTCPGGWGCNATMTNNLIVLDVES